MTGQIYRYQFPVDVQGTDAVKAFGAALQSYDYYQAGLARYNDIANRTTKSTEGAGGLRVAASGPEMIAAWTSAGSLLAFSIELAVKAAAYQRARALPRREHKIEVLVNAMGTDFVADLRRRFDESKGKVNHLAFDVSYQGMKGEKKDGSGKDTFEQALAEVSNLFIELRYYFESFDATHLRRFDFSNLFRIAEALHNALREYPGKFQLQLHGPAN